MVGVGNSSSIHEKVTEHFLGTFFVSESPGRNRRLLALVLVVVIVVTFRVNNLANNNNDRQEKERIYKDREKIEDNSTLDLMEPETEPQKELGEKNQPSGESFNQTCQRNTGWCGLVTLHGHLCDPPQAFSGEFHCYDSSITGCGLGHQLNAVAVMQKNFGEKFRVVEPIVCADHAEIHEESYATILREDLVLPREYKYSHCARVYNGYRAGPRTAAEIATAEYVPDTLVPFMENFALPYCPDLPMLPDAVAVKVRLSDIKADFRGTRHLTIKDYCDALETQFEFTNVIVVTDGQKLDCPGMNITHIESLETPKMYQSTAQKIMCNLRYIAQYPRQVSNVQSNLQLFIYADMMRFGTFDKVYDVFSLSWVNSTALRVV